MRVLRQGLILPAMLCAFAPSVVGAAPILFDSNVPTRPCEGIVPNPDNCVVFSLSSLTELKGSFGTDSDVALFEFILDVNSMFSAETTSYLTTRFNSMLGLFDALTGLNVTYSNPPVFAKGADIDTTNCDPNAGPLSCNLDDRMEPFTLGPGRYFLALLNNNSFANGFTFDDVAGLDSLAKGFGCDDPALCLGSDAAGEFSVALNAVPEINPPQPVPEPATITLVATGALAAMARRRSTKRNQRKNATRS